jgi:GT2 family glycosyltransferase
VESLKLNLFFSYRNYFSINKVINNKGILEKFSINMYIMHNTWPKVSIVTINYNGTLVTAELLKSLEKVTYPDLEVIVVDNGSKVPGRQLAEDFPWIKYLETGENLGFAGGNNRGMEISTGNYILLLNNDTEVDPGFLEPLVERFQSNAAIGIVCPKILYFDSPETIQFAGFGPISPVTGRGFSIGYMEKDLGQYNLAMKTNRAHGAAMMFSRKAMQKVGMMAELFFLYYEEMDYCERFKRARFEIWYEPMSQVWHKESMSTGKGSTLKTYYYSRNRLLYLRRNTPWKIKFLMYPYYFLIAVPKNILSLLFKGEKGHLSVFIRGIWWNFTHDSSDPND